MYRVFGRLSELVTARPWITLFVLLIVTVALGAGAGLREPPAETAAALPQGSAITKAMAEIEDLFGDAGDVRVVTLLFRGNAISPEGLVQMAALLDDIAGDPAVVEILAPVDPIFAPSSLFKAVLQADNLTSITQAQIDTVRGVPEAQQALAVMTGSDSEGSPVAIASIRLRNTGDERLVDAEWKINDLAVGSDGPLLVCGD